MRQCYIITYDLVNPGRNYDALLLRIKSYAGWAKLGGSSYLILVDNKTSVQIRDHLLEALDKNDTLYVGLMSNVAAWIGLGEDVSNWIRNNQK